MVLANHHELDEVWSALATGGGPLDSAHFRRLRRWIAQLDLAAAELRAAQRRARALLPRAPRAKRLAGAPPAIIGLRRNY